MNKIMKLIQGTPEWHEHRRRYRNASETPAVLGLSPWQTPYELWLEKTGRRSTEATFPMRRGAGLEPAARAAYEALTGHVMEPLVIVDGEYSASLDGITLAGDLILEIKCPLKGKASELWQRVAEGALPEHYVAQVQHQLMVAGAAAAHVYVFDGSEGALVEIQPKSSEWNRIREGWGAFVAHLATDTAPPLCERDTLIRDDAAWQKTAETYVRAKQQADDAASALEAAKAALVGLSQHASEAGAGVTVTRYWKAGSVDYKKVPQLKDVNLEQYRSASRLETRITVSG